MLHVVHWIDPDGKPCRIRFLSIAVAEAYADLLLACGRTGVLIVGESA